ncbi:hypothetical protein HAX54_049040, partial [Datura stramonium]|nr:hypothetical protein [Datura stramonium]
LSNGNIQDFVQNMVNSAKDFYIIRHEKLGGPRDKRSCTSGTYNGISLGDRGFSRRSFHPQSSRLVNTVIQAFEEGSFG